MVKGPYNNTKTTCFDINVFKEYRLSLCIDTYHMFKQFSHQEMRSINIL